MLTVLVEEHHKGNNRWRALTFVQRHDPGEAVDTREHREPRERTDPAAVAARARRAVEGFKPPPTLIAMPTGSLPPPPLLRPALLRARRPGSDGQTHRFRLLVGSVCSAHAWRGTPPAQLSAGPEPARRAPQRRAR